MYLVAWAIVEGENNLSWEWFFLQLQSSLELGEGDNICIIYDLHQSILNVVSNVLPKEEHRHCARNIFALWHKSYIGDEMRLLFWKIAKSFSMANYKDALQELTELNMEAAESFKGYKPEFFCRVFLKTTFTTDAITSNMAETFNGKKLHLQKMEHGWIPCYHVVACIYFQNKEAEEFVDHCYRRDTYLMAYAGSIPPVQGERHWPRLDSPLHPPPIKIGPGRPRKNRIKDPFENPKKPGTLTKSGVEMTCSVFLVKGHNKHKCPNKDLAAAREPPAKKPRGRPRKDGQSANTSAAAPPPQFLIPVNHYSRR